MIFAVTDRMGDTPSLSPFLFRFTYGGALYKRTLGRRDRAFWVFGRKAPGRPSCSRRHRRENWQLSSRDVAPRSASRGRCFPPLPRARSILHLAARGSPHRKPRRLRLSYASPPPALVTPPCVTSAPKAASRSSAMLGACLQHPLSAPLALLPSPAPRLRHSIMGAARAASSPPLATMRMPFALPTLRIGTCRGT